MANLATQRLGLTGTTVTFVAASAGGDTLTPAGGTFLHVKNGGVASINVTVDSVRPCDQGSDHDLVVAVAAGAEKLIPVQDAARFANTSGLATVTYSAVTSVTVAAVAV